MSAKKRKLYTTGDIAEKLGVTRQYALTFVNDKRRGFPEEFDTLPGGMQVWLIDDVDPWLAAHPELRQPLAEDPES